MTLRTPSPPSASKDQWHLQSHNKPYHQVSLVSSTSNEHTVCSIRSLSLNKEPRPKH